MIHRDLILPVPVLLIDDQVEALQNLSHILQNFGYLKRFCFVAHRSQMQC